MRFSVWAGMTQPFDDVLATARYAEDAGWDGFYVADHFMSNFDDMASVLECWTTIAAVAALVPRIRLGSLVAGNTYRHPAVLANMATTIDHISGGRLILGVGAGWQQNEHDAYGIELPPVGPRLKRFAEACAVLRSMLRETRTTFEGEYYSLHDAPLEPRPIQTPLPLLIGGVGEQVMLGIVARYADEWNCWADPETLRHKIGVLHEHCERVGRDPREIKVSAQSVLLLEGENTEGARRPATLPTMSGSPAQVAEVVAAYRDAGADELIVPDFSLGEGDERLRIYGRFWNEVAQDFR